MSLGHIRSTDFVFGVVFRKQLRSHTWGVFSEEMSCGFVVSTCLDEHGSGYGQSIGR